MEKASGELSLTVVTIIAVAAIAGLVAILVPKMGDWVNNTFDSVASTSVNVQNP